MSEDKDVNTCIASLRQNDVYSISRNDIISEMDDKNKIIKALFWGYPSLKKKDCANLSKIIDTVMPFLVKSKNRVVGEEKINAFINSCSSLHLPIGAFSKFLYFFKLKYKQNGDCLIVDRFLEIGMREFSEFNDVSCDYFDICKKINSLSKDLGVSSEQLEFFLFFIGRHLQYQEKSFRALLEFSIGK